MLMSRLMQACNVNYALFHILKIFLNGIHCLFFWSPSRKGHFGNNINLLWPWVAKWSKSRDSLEAWLGKTLLHSIDQSKELGMQVSLLSHSWRSSRLPFFKEHNQVASLSKLKMSKGNHLMNYYLKKNLNGFQYLSLWSILSLKNPKNH
jgi:hypothetical protein